MEDPRYISYLPTSYPPHTLRLFESEPIYPKYQTLLTTIVDLQRNYAQNNSEFYENSPLDLSVKTSAEITPPSTPSPIRKRPATPVESENPKRFKDGCFEKVRSFSESSLSQDSFIHIQRSVEKTPCKSETIKQNLPASKKKTPAKDKSKLSKAVRKLQFDDETKSPVSGTIIRELGDDEHLVVRKGDIDPKFNVVEVTDEAKSELSKIENVIGEYLCRLCKELYEDAFQLAQHRCSRIMLIEYRCPECDKVFNCPANLASHRRWHKPREQQQTEKLESKVSGVEEQFPCEKCGKRFRRQAYLRKHISTNHKEDLKMEDYRSTIDAANVLTSLRHSGTGLQQSALMIS